MKTEDFNNEWCEIRRENIDMYENDSKAIIKLLSEISTSLYILAKTLDELKYK